MLTIPLIAVLPIPVLLGQNQDNSVGVHRC
jgi:hypothetical protein